MRNAGRLAWLLIAAVALAASACGHALELSLENLRLFGDGRANYAHPAQILAVEVAVALFVIVTAAMLRRLWRCALRAGQSGDCLVPALDGIVRLGLARSAAALIGVQFVALVSSEFLEQRWAGFHGGLASIIGSGHITTIAVHVIVGLCFALALYRFARFVCSQTSALVGAIATFVRRLRASFTKAAPSYRHVTLWASSRRPALLALGLANRPPPTSFTYAA